MYKRNILRSSIIRLYEQHAMYSAKGSSAPYDGEKQTKERNAISVERRAVCLLSRRYTLTATGYKFLEIGINIGPPRRSLRGDRSGRLSGTGTYTISRNVDRTLRAAMEYLQIAAKRLQR
ncbi:uncharacterized protein LOC105422965 isoform X1 [Pogonomyrmex barbatus]|uniref:Uncharacterized protein LOC105422965 isoform X1 n=1 Tax=Pogonomyrmex barbatus TaxID=144034 RepID=A0A6I9VST0_9HYME|nr:uncharacterized protein LOC105422965 isoform X1 [Pogonomyrmex barbatus]